MTGHEGQDFVGMATGTDPLERAAAAVHMGDAFTGKRATEAQIAEALNAEGVPVTDTAIADVKRMLGY